MFAVAQINYSRKFFPLNPGFPGTCGVNVHLMVFSLSPRGQNWLVQGAFCLWAEQIIQMESLLLY